VTEPGNDAASEPGPGPARVLVVIPTYDERETLPITLPALRRAVPEADVLVVDDNSPDGTGDLAEELSVDDPSVHVMHRAGKQGLGVAYLAGFAWALERGYDVIVEMDADGSHRAQDLPRLLAAVPNADVVIGSRWVAGGRVMNWPRHREALSRGGNAYTRAMLRIPTRDATAGFRAYRAEVLRTIDLGSVDSQGYCFQVDLTRRALAAGFRVVEVPITFVEREHGRSKMSRAIVAEALAQVTVWGVQQRLGRGSTGRRATDPGAPASEPHR
jgi:dolichol-phosphate mannosyltransferase